MRRRGWGEERRSLAKTGSIHSLMFLQVGASTKYFVAMSPFKCASKDFAQVFSYFSQVARILGTIIARENFGKSILFSKTKF